MIMKKTILLATAFWLFAAGTVNFIDSTTGSQNATSGTGIKGSKHDLSSLTGLDSIYLSNTPTGGAKDPLDRVCIWCHTPHHSMVEANWF